MKKKQYAVIVASVNEAMLGRVERVADSMTGAYRKALEASGFVGDMKTEADVLFKGCYNKVANTSLKETRATNIGNAVYVKVRRYWI